MRAGDIVVLHITDNTLPLPCREVGRWGDTRFVVDPGSPGLVLGESEFYAERWLRVAFPEGTGWVRDTWVAAVADI